MASITFTAGTVIPSTWLNDVNAIVYGSASPPANPICVDLSGNVGIGVSTPITAKFEVVQANAIQALFRSTLNTGYTSVRLYNDQNINSRSLEIDYSGSAFAGSLITGGPTGESAAISTTGAFPLVLGTNNTARLQIDASGNVLNTSSGGLGYGTGSGGTVTQATSKSTAVTLNKTNGQIVMNNSSLAAGATVGFAFNNSTIASTDVVHITYSAAGASADYNMWVYRTTAGQALIAVKNIGAAPLAEVVTINFAVIKAVTA